MAKLSTGEEATLGNYRKLCAAFFGPESKPVKFLDEEIADQGEDAEVIQHESQMIILFASMLGEDE